MRNNNNFRHSNSFSNANNSDDLLKVYSRTAGDLANIGGKTAMPDFPNTEYTLKEIGKPALALGGVASATAVLFSCACALRKLF